MALKAWRKFGKLLRDSRNRVMRCAVCPCGGPTTDRCCGGSLPATMYMTCYLFYWDPILDWPTWADTGVSIVVELTYDPDLRISIFGAGYHLGGWKGTAKFHASGPTLGVAWTCLEGGGFYANFYQDQGSGIDWYDGVDDIAPLSDGTPIYQYITQSGVIDCDTQTQDLYEGTVERAALANFYPIDWHPSYTGSQSFDFIVSP